MIISPDSLYIALRNEVKKGFDYLSMTDGTRISKIEGMHVNPITQLLFLNQAKFVISSSRDKKIKIWNMSTLELEKLLPTYHSNSVEQIVLSENQQTLFSGSIDQTVGIWCLSNYHLLAIIKLDIKIKDLEFSENR